METEDKGLRFNTGKTRYDLIDWFSQQQKAQVFTKGAIKYEPNNWLRGMKWSKCYASALRHAAAWMRGEDYDIDPNCQACKESKESGNWTCTNHTGELHSALAAWNWDAITSYYKHYPQGDDRLHRYLKKTKIGLDVDDVLADWVGHWTKYHGQEVPENWNFDRNIQAKFDSLKDDKEFWLSIPVKTKPSDIHFEPHCYITSRSVPKEWTEEWLDKNGFPTVRVHSIGFGQSKIQVAKESGIEIFVDDRFDNFVELNNAGICCFLFDCEHNQRYDVGYKRIKSLKELPV